MCIMTQQVTNTQAHVCECRTSGLSDYSADDLRRTVELLVLHDSSADPVERRVLCLWYTHVYQQMDSRFRELAEMTVRAMREQSYVSVL